MTPAQTAVIASTLSAAIGYLALKNCGTGPGGFQPGNVCARNSRAGSARRTRAGKRRRKRGPGRKPNPKARQKRGEQRQARLAHEVRTRHLPDHAEIHADHAISRQSLAEEIRGERAYDREQGAYDRSQVAADIRRERNDSRDVRRGERHDLGREQRQAAHRLGIAQRRQTERLAAYHARHPEKTPGQHQADRDRIAEQHRQGTEELREQHRDERAELLDTQRQERADERESHRDTINEHRTEAQEARRERHDEQRRQIAELRAEHRRELAEADREAARGEKAYDAIDAKATPDPAVPDADAILATALEATGHADAWHAGTLGGDESLEVLHAVRMEGRAWFRSEAERLLAEVGGESVKALFSDDAESKALFGAIKGKVGAFFDRAKKHVKELVAAGILAIAGPGPILEQPAIADEYHKQVAIQAEYLADFRKQIVAEAKPLDGTFVGRAEQYGNAPWSASQQVMREFSRKMDIFDEEMREHLGKDKPCVTCIEEIKKKWRPIGSLKSIGDSICRSGCHCRFLYRKGKDGEPHTAGRGPLFDPVFGRTG